MNAVTETDTETDTPSAEPVAVHPGQRLRLAREQRGLTRDQVAAELRLNPQLVTAIEENDLERLPPASFVAGYQRSYARLVEIPPESLGAGGEELAGEPPRLVSRSRPAQASSQDLPVRLFTWVLLIGLSVLLGLWWLSQRPAYETTATTPVPAETAAPVVGSLPLPPTATDPAGEPLSEAAPAAADGAGSAPLETPSPATPVPAEAPVAAAPPPVAAIPPAPAPAVPAITLRVVYEADSWTEITDANGTQLVFDLIRAGRDLSVSGQPPFKLFFGYSPGVSLYVEGAPFDHKRFQRRDLARFTVDP
jgi:cytoskeleton protein RodZ